MTNAPPSRNQAMDNTLVGVLDLFRSKFLQNMDDMLPAKVIAYDRAANRAQVQPLIYQVTTANERINRAQIASIPVLQIGGGGFVTSFPLKVGDLGWIKASDRDISFFLKTYSQAAPNTQRKHSFSDALFVPDSFMSGVVIAGEDANNLVIQNLAGSVKIAWWNSLLKLVAPVVQIISQVGIGGAPDANAILDLQSTTKAFMPPRMTQGQRDAIPSPQEGMVVWNLSTHGLSTYNGSAWS